MDYQEKMTTETKVPTPEETALSVTDVLQRTCNLKAAVAIIRARDALIRVEERERCATIALNYWKPYMPMAREVAALDIAAAIRALPEEKNTCQHNWYTANENEERCDLCGDRRRQ